MRDFDRIKERLEDAADYAERLLKLLQRMQRKVEAAPELYQQNEAERGLRLGTDVLAALQDMLAAGCTPRPDDAEQAYNPQRALCVDVCYESPHILRCTCSNKTISENDGGTLSWLNRRRLLPSGPSCGRS